VSCTPYLGHVVRPKIGGAFMSTFNAVRADAREFHRVASVLGGLLVQVAGLFMIYAWTLARGLLRMWWASVQENAERGARGWR